MFVRLCITSGFPATQDIYSLSLLPPATASPPLVPTTLIPVWTCVCTHNHTHARAHTHSLTHAHVHSHSHAHTHTCTYTQTHMHALRCVRTHSLTHTHARTHSHTVSPPPSCLAHAVLWPHLRPADASASKARRRRVF